MKWAPVPGLEDRYKVSDSGRVRAIRRKEVVFNRWGTTTVRYRQMKDITPVLYEDGYHYVFLDNGGKTVKWRLARLVLTAFRGPSTLEAGHINHRRTDNRLKNLEWVTRVENERQKQDPKRNRANAVLTRIKVAHMRRLATRGYTYEYLASRFGCAPSTAARACKGETWA